MKTGLSDCHGAPVKKTIQKIFLDKKVYYECRECNEPCDLAGEGEPDVVDMIGGDEGL